MSGAAGEAGKGGAMRPLPGGGIDPAEIVVDHFRGPFGVCGFRSGFWTVTYRGRDYRVFSSVPHAVDLDVQASIVRVDAARQIAPGVAS